jgi:23S rRNA pseudouridine1911/1915/1917 synthase
LRELSPRGADVAVAIGCVFVDRKRATDPRQTLRAGQRVTANLGRPFRSALLGQVASSPLPEPRELYRDEHVLVAFKPAGLLTAPTPEGLGGNLKSWFESRVGELFVVHRLDLQTSGVLILARTTEANRVLAETFQRHQLVRRYDAFVAPGYPRDSETVSEPIDGRPATSYVVVRARLEHTTQLEVTLETGRTHQIRKHLLGRGYPVLGDREYGTRTAFDPPRMALHARVLELDHPVTGERLSFEQPLPPELLAWLG